MQKLKALPIKGLIQSWILWWLLILAHVIFFPNQENQQDPLWYTLLLTFYLSFLIGLLFYCFRFALNKLVVSKGRQVVSLADLLVDACWVVSIFVLKSSYYVEFIAPTLGILAHYMSLRGRIQEPMVAWRSGLFVLLYFPAAFGVLMAAFFLLGFGVKLLFEIQNLF